MPSAIDRASEPTGLWSVLKTAASDWLRHKSSRLGAALAYYSVFSLGPLLLIVTAIAGLVWGGDSARSSIVSQFRALVGESGGQAIEAMLQGASSSVAGGWSAVIGVSLLLVAAVGVVVQLKDALNTIFEVSEPKTPGAAWYAKVYGGAFAGILVLGFLLAVSLVLSALPVVMKANEGVRDMDGFIDNIEEATEENANFRHVLYTGNHLQLVMMSIAPGEDIGEEVHEGGDQFFRIENGHGLLTIDGRESEITDGDGIVVPAGARHNIKNVGEEPLKLYTLYAPPHHRNGHVAATRADAQENHEEFDGTTSE